MPLQLQFVPYLADHFTGSCQSTSAPCSLTGVATNGWYNEDAGLLSISTDDNDTSRWDLATNNLAPRAWYVQFAPYNDSNDTFLSRHETRLTYYQGTSASTAAGLFVGQEGSSTNPRVYKFSYAGDSLIFCDRVSAGSYAFLSGTGADSIRKPQDAGSAIRLRIYHNETGSAYTVPDDNFSLPDGHIAFYYSIDDGENFTRLYSEDFGNIANTSTAVGFQATSVGVGPSTASFDYLKSEHERLVSIPDFDSCSDPYIDGNFTINTYGCLGAQHRDSNNNGLEHVPFGLGAKYLHIRRK